MKNSEKTIRETINSIVNQDFSHEQIEIIVVKGESKDRTMPIIKEILSKTDIRVKIFSDNGEGLGVARQIVVDEANSKYILWIDGDVVVSRDLIRKQVDFMERNPHVGISAGKMMFRQQTGVVGTLNALFQYTIEGRIGCHATMYRTKAIREIGGFDKEIKGASEDSDAQFRIKQNDWSVCVNQEARWYHNCRDELRDLWNERFWFGYGDYYMYHKHKNARRHIKNMAPFLFSISGLQHSLRAYKQTHLKKSFLLPILCFVMSISWLSGFVKARLDGYTHA